MKRRILYNLLIISFFISCGSDSGEDDVKKDDLLSATKWRYEFKEPLSVISEDGVFDPSSSIRMYLASLSYNYPPIDLSRVSIDYIYENEEDSVFTTQTTQNEIKFMNNQCIYEFKTLLSGKKRQLKRKYMSIKLPNQEGKNKNGVICKILPDGIYLVHESFEPIEQVIQLKLEDSQYTQKTSQKEVLSEKDITQIKGQLEVSLFFERFENEIIIENDSLKWSGTLNKKKDILTVEQIKPNKKYIGDFLKQ